MSSRFEIHSDGTGGYRLLLTDEQCGLLCAVGSFPDKQAAAKAVMQVREAAATAHIIDLSSVPGEAGAPTLAPAEDDQPRVIHAVSARQRVRRDSGAEQALLPRSA
ncbi:hypothetical protein AHIS1636_31550 [Arthrobacter mangrovi]|uniref:DUF1508 domain-containing protein n=1 Tax=Arthrobacter mangrovi TaxID=2966350 RepID=A0ABQ5MXT3_9MICC|nr:hypothetical protein AHIS1636_31550 [Arthrobacter mangrovi]